MFIQKRLLFLVIIFPIHFYHCVLFTLEICLLCFKMFCKICKFWPNLALCSGNDHLVFTLQKLVQLRVILCHTEFTLERRMGDIIKQRRY